MIFDATKYDAIIVGAGPAGTSAAIRLAQKGRRVVLLEAKQFPRHKLCGEFISPECFPHFRTLGVLDEMFASGGTRIAETCFYSASGSSVSVPSEWFGEAGSDALGLSRAKMDMLLLDAARKAGVAVYEETRVNALVFDGERVCGVRVADDGKQNSEGQGFEVRAAVVLDATGRARVLAKMVERAESKLNGRKIQNAKRPRAALVAFKAHLENERGFDGNNSSDDRRCEIYFYPGGYGGINWIEGERGNVCLIVRAEDVRRCGSDAERVLCEVVFKNERARAVLGNARAVTPWLSVALEGFGRHSLTPARGLLAVGDAASFIDPFTGSGMLMALESGAVAAEAVAAWLGCSDDHAPELLAAEYAALYAARFDYRLRLCSYLRRAAFAPSFVVETAVAAFSISDGVRRRFARATRGAKQGMKAEG